MSTIQQVKDSLKRSCAAYNEKKKALQNLFSLDTEHSENWKVEQLQKKKEAIRNEYTANIKEIQSRLSKAERETIQKIGNLKYPASTSISDSLKTSGEMQINTAQLFLNRKHSPESILSTIKQAIALGRIDYAFSLIEGTKENVKPASTGFLSQENKDFLNELEALTTAFDTNGELSGLEQDLQAVPAVESSAISFLQFLSMNDSTTDLVVLPELADTPEEKKNILDNLGSYGLNLTEQVALKRSLVSK